MVRDMTESITRIRGTGLPGPSPFGIMLPLLQIRSSSLASSFGPFRFSVSLPPSRLPPP